jgi:hypothetical protein
MSYSAAPLLSQARSQFLCLCQKHGRFWRFVLLLHLRLRNRQATLTYSIQTLLLFLVLLAQVALPFAKFGCLLVSRALKLDQKRTTSIMGNGAKVDYNDTHQYQDYS